MCRNFLTGKLGNSRCPHYDRCTRVNKTLNLQFYKHNPCSNTFVWDPYDPLCQNGRQQEVRRILWITIPWWMCTRMSGIIDAIGQKCKRPEAVQIWAHMRLFCLILTIQVFFKAMLFCLKFSTWASISTAWWLTWLLLPTLAYCWFITYQADSNQSQL